MTHFAGTSTIKHLSCAHLGSYSLALNTRDEVYIWGYYQSSVATTSMPFRVDLPSQVRSFRQISTSRNLLSVLDKQGNLWIWTA